MNEAGSRMDVFALVLGIMQDAGLPHAGCRCPRCRTAFGDPAGAQYAAALAIVDTRPMQPTVWLIDATPDLKFQLNALAMYLGYNPARPERLRPPDGVFLTHGHMGHTLGLAHLGPEAMSVEQLPVYGPAGLLRVLAETVLWQPAISRFTLIPLPPLVPFALAPDLTIMPRPVPHRDEWGAGTYAYQVNGPRRRLLYLPDIDRWADWPVAREVLAGVDVALVDASFWSRAELEGHPPVAHPLVPDTLRLMADLPTQILLTHLNHTNPLLDPAGAVRQWLARWENVAVAQFGQRLPL